MANFICVMSAMLIGGALGFIMVLCIEYGGKNGLVHKGQNNNDSKDDENK